jgi:hypothetical protein
METVGVANSGPRPFCGKDIGCDCVRMKSGAQSNVIKADAGGRNEAICNIPARSPGSYRTDIGYSINYPSRLCLPLREWRSPRSLQQHARN